MPPAALKAFAYYNSYSLSYVDRTFITVTITLTKEMTETLMRFSNLHTIAWNDSLHPINKNKKSFSVFEYKNIFSDTYFSQEQTLPELPELCSWLHFGWNYAFELWNLNGASQCLRSVLNLCYYTGCYLLSLIWALPHLLDHS